MAAPVSLRPVEMSDLPVFFVDQLDPEATRMAAFPSREREAFMRHWTNNVLGNPANTSRTIVVDGGVAGNVCAWTDAGSGERLLGYWIGREFWGRGVASAAVALFLRSELTRPLHAHVVRHNAGSIRVLVKNGFVRVREERFALADGTTLEELVYVLPA